MKAEAKCYECLDSLVLQTAGLSTDDEHLRAQAIAAGREALKEHFSVDAVTIRDYLKRN